VASRPDADFRATLSHFASGVVIVTGMAAAAPAGLTCQSFFSLSLDPPLVAIAVGKASASWARIAASGAFCVNVVSADQERACQAFARSGHDKFAGVSWAPALTGSPRLDGALAWIDCRIAAIHEAGDHYLVVGAVSDLGTGSGDPLLYFRGQFNRLSA
jgi:flavin reductase (DIM6/NTAB) family NADH-FMN oxidoreductase RutF